VNRSPLPTAALLAALSACRSAPKPSGAEAGASAPQAAVEVETAPALQGPFPVTVEALGTVVPRPGSYASLGAPAPTRVRRIYVATGDSVQPGVPLVDFERASFDAEAARAATARTSARRALERAQRLANMGILPRKEVDQAASDLAQAEAAYVAAQRVQELATLRAPIRGVVAWMSAVVNQPVDATQPLIGIVDPAALELVLTVSPGEAAKVHAGDSLTMMDPRDPSAEALGWGAVIAVAPTVDSLGRGVAVRARVTRSRRLLRLGEGLTAAIEIAVHQGAVSVPQEALVPEGDQFKVFVVDSANLAHGAIVSVGSEKCGGHFVR